MARDPRPASAVGVNHERDYLSTRPPRTLRDRLLWCYLRRRGEANRGRAGHARDDRLVALAEACTDSRGRVVSWWKRALIYLGKQALAYAGEKIVAKADKELAKIEQARKPRTAR